MTISCPDNGPPRPDADVAIPASIGTTSISPNLAVQIICESGSYCVSRARSNSGAYVELDYPIFSPAARFRVRIFVGAGNGQFLSYVEWQVGFSGEAQQMYYQPKGKWFQVVVPLDATSVQISGNAVVNGEMPSEPTSMQTSIPLI